MNDEISELTVFYDPRCGVCSRFREWFVAQALWIPVRFVGYQEPVAEVLMPGLGDLDPGKECIVLADDGHWWQGSDSWLVCLWATREYRLWSSRLAAPLFRPILIKIVDLISSNRLRISRVLKMTSDKELALQVDKHELECDDNGCQWPAWRTELKKGKI
jgi:predicted DCC family thiol-disulfide oxidoreductase YuxK